MFSGGALPFVILRVWISRPVSEKSSNFEQGICWFAKAVNLGVAQFGMGNLSAATTKRHFTGFGRSKAWPTLST